MTPKDIFEQYLLMGESITLGFDTKQQLIAFKTQLHTVRWKQNKTYTDLGLPPLVANSEITAEIITQQPLQVRFSLREKTQKVAAFTIIQ